MKWALFLALLASVGCFGSDTGVTTQAGQGYSKLAFPSPDPGIFRNLVIHVDHLRKSAFSSKCRDHRDRGFPHCYGGHSGTDFLLKKGFRAMDKGVPVTAAQSGTVIYVDDSHYDRCRFKLFKGRIDCGKGNQIIANLVVVEQEDGLFALYYHVRQGSALVKVGQKVRCGEQLALVGSAGLSATPHLHFELARKFSKIYKGQDPVDPYKENLWREVKDGSPLSVCQ